MVDGRERFIRQLESASKRVGIMTADEIATLFRRAALRLRDADGIGLDPDVAEKLDEVADLTGAGRDELASLVLRDWLVSNGYLPFHELDEETEPQGAE